MQQETRQWHSLHNMAPHANNEIQPPPVKADRWLIGLVAGAVLIYLLGKSLGLRRHEKKDMNNIG